MRLLFVILALVVGVGCDSQADEPLPPAGLSATINGRAFRPVSVETFLDPGPGGRSTYVIRASEFGADGFRTLSLDVPGRPGSYTITNVSASYEVFGRSFTDVQTWRVGSAWVGSQITLRVVEATATRVAGTFAFTAIGEDRSRIAATNGTFNLAVDAD